MNTPSFQDAIDQLDLKGIVVLQNLLSQQALNLLLQDEGKTESKIIELQKPKLATASFLQGIN